MLEQVEKLKATEEACRKERAALLEALGVNEGAMLFIGIAVGVGLGAIAAAVLFAS
jgi:hypothetical protein